MIGYITINDADGNLALLLDEADIKQLVETPTGEKDMATELDFGNYIKLHRDWSSDTFGPGHKTEGICRHIEEEIEEIRSNPNDLEEWIDVIILAIDGAWRRGFTPGEMCDALVKKQLKNRRRRWPEPGSVPEDQPTNHIREAGR